MSSKSTLGTLVVVFVCVLITSSAILFISSKSAKNNLSKVVHSWLYVLNTDTQIAYFSFAVVSSLLLVLLSSNFFLNNAQKRNSESRNLDENSLAFVSWNIAGVNNNPFEYLVPGFSKSYDKLLAQVEAILREGKEECLCKNAFSSAQIGEFFKALATNLPGQEHLALEMRLTLWERLQDVDLYKGFLLNPAFGRKRLISRADRLTNTIEERDGRIVYRPCATNAYDGPAFASYDDWFERWMKYMFGPTSMRAKAVSKMSQTKYPQLTQEEETMSVVYQLLCLLLFDAAVFRLLNLAQVTSGTNWQLLRGELSREMVLSRSDRIFALLTQLYAPDSDAVFIQEVPAEIIHRLAKDFESEFEVFSPALEDYGADLKFSSAIIVRRNTFLLNGARVYDVSVIVAEAASKLNVDVSSSDVAAYLVESSEGEVASLLASFHGDSDGRSTVCIMDVLADTAARNMASLYIGMDANCHWGDNDGNRLNVETFFDAAKARRLAVCFPRDNGLRSTTFNIRTVLQPQTHKGSISTKGDKGRINRHPKDYIMAFESEGHFAEATGYTADPKRSKGEEIETTEWCDLDNTGSFEYLSKQMFPTRNFPSDHAVVLAKFIKKCKD